LERLRARRGWSRKDLAGAIIDSARMAGVGLRTGRMQVWRWENDAAYPAQPAQLALADLLGVPRDAVLDRPWPVWLTDHVSEPVT
jgi:transcriptional regulator with XRE-family HTH domain